MTIRSDLAHRRAVETRLLSQRRGVGRIPALPRTPGEQRFPAAVSQEGMWQELSRQEGGPALAIVSGLRIRGALDTGLLNEAWNAVLARHETLRTALVVDNGALTQVVAESVQVEIPVTALRTRAEFDEVSRQEVDRPFPLDQRPLSRLSLFRLAADDHLGLLLTHHIICDARAQEVLARDLAACYLACAAGAEPVLPPLPVQWADFAAWHRRRLAGPRGAEELAYWSRRMSGAVPALLPADVEPPPHQGPRDAQRGDMLITAVPPDLFAAVSKLTRTYRTTFYTVGLVAFAVLLARRSGQRDIGVNAPISYRDRVELHDLVADFSNDVIVRTDLSGAPTFDDLLHNARSALSEDFARYDLPPHLLTPYLSDPELIRRMQHVQFTAEREVELPEQTGPLRIEPVIPPRQYVLRPLSVRFRHDDDHAILIARYRTNRFTRQRAAELVAEYLGLLGEMAADPRRRALPG